jgi:phosphatidylglycerophosphatase C
VTSAALTSVAAFDFDGTLTTRDCVLPFLEKLAGRSQLARGMMSDPFATAGAIVRRDRDRLKAIAVRAAYAGREALNVDRIGASFAEIIQRSWLRPDTFQRLEWHQRQGHRVVLVSASLGTYLRPLGKMLGVDAVLCTEVFVGPDGRYTGDLDGRNCRGEEKLRRLRAWLTEMQLENAELWAYGDSAGDRELLSAAHHHVFVKNCTLSAQPSAAA